MGPGQLACYHYTGTLIALNVPHTANGFFEGAKSPRLKWEELRKRGDSEGVVVSCRNRTREIASIVTIAINISTTASSTSSYIPLITLLILPLLLPLGASHRNHWARQAIYR